MATQTMQALHYDGPFKVSVKEIERPKIQHPDDVIIKVTTAAICGSDLQQVDPLKTHMRGQEESLNNVTACTKAAQQPRAV